jgi:four helix bundle protein
MHPFERLDAWRACHQLTLSIYVATRDWPRTEQYGLTSQLRRAAASAATNIAEGGAKRGRAEFRRFLDIANGSLSEVAYLLMLARDIGILSRDDWERMDSVRAPASRLTWRLYQSMSRSDRPPA